MSQMFYEQLFVSLSFFLLRLNTSGYPFDFSKLPVILNLKLFIKNKNKSNKNVIHCTLYCPSHLDNGISLTLDNSLLSPSCRYISDEGVSGFSDLL